MDQGVGESRLIPRLFLVAPEGSADHLAACFRAARAAGDVASLLLPPSLARDLTPLAQELGVAVLTTGVTPNADGVHVDATTESVTAARQSVGKNRIVGAFAGHSRHFAMEAAEAGADYVALSQHGTAIGGEPILKWWSNVFEIPCVAFDPVDITELDTLLPQTPDFVRPPDAMWDGPEAARLIVTELTQRLQRT